jgi:hypothetical protein
MITNTVPGADDIVVRYASGFPTRLPRHSRLAAMLRAHGKPSRIRRLGSGQILIEWPPIFPGVPDPEYSLADPWRHLGDRREIVGIELGNP